MPLYLASGNAHKLQELQDSLGVPLLSQKELAPLPEWIEDGDSFEANALIKARGLRDFSGHWALADDSGLEVDALDGAPGIHSARFAGEHGNDAANNELLLKKLQNQPNRSARFVCVLALCGPGGQELVLRGTCEGEITQTPSGEHGFGYDPLFQPHGYANSFAELGADIKARISHRAQALRLLKEHENFLKFSQLFR